MYIEDVQIGDVFRKKGQTESVDVQIESWITEQTQLLVDTDYGEADELPEHFNYEKPAFSSTLEATTQLVPGEKHVFKCLFAGVPLPEAEWLIDGSPLEITR